MFSDMWSKKSCKISDHHNKQGLRILILTKITCENSNVVVKPIFLPTQITKSTPSNHHQCSLKSCHLCHKHLPLDKQIYMYRGDLGFCSVECRDRQIYLDETKEIELSTKRIFSSFRRDGAGGRCETSKDFRRRRHPVSSSNNRVVFLFS